jgi:hypothetical protein
MSIIFHNHAGRFQGLSTAVLRFGQADPAHKSQFDQLFRYTRAKGRGTHDFYDPKTGCRGQITIVHADQPSISVTHLGSIKLPALKGSDPLKYGCRLDLGCYSLRSYVDANGQDEDRYYRALTPAQAQLVEALCRATQAEST